MKKSLIALAALATVATAAQAQSSVTLYGVIDVGVASISNVANGSTSSTVTGMQNGGSGTSRWGVRGTEDLGGGLKAGFTLESEFLADTGSTKSSAESLFNRESSVSLAGSVGELKLGRFNSFTYGQGAKFDSFGGNNFGGYIAIGLYNVRIENAAQYLSPTVNGFTFGAQTGTRVARAAYPGTTVVNYGEVAGKTEANRNSGLLVSYANGPLELAATYNNLNDGSGNKVEDVYAAFARYNFGKVKAVAGYYQQDLKRKVTTTDATSAALVSGDNQKIKHTFLGANVDLTSNLVLNLAAGEVEYDRYLTTKRKPTYQAAGLTYNLSKRTSLYGIVAQSQQDNGSALAIASTSKFSFTTTAGADTAGVSPAADKNQTGLMVGVRHNF